MIFFLRKNNHSFSPCKIYIHTILYIAHGFIDIQRVQTLDGEVSLNISP